VVEVLDEVLDLVSDGSHPVPRPATASAGSTPAGDMAERTRAGHSMVTPAEVSARASAVCSATVTTACLVAA
jgi:hypothetical protein